MNKYFTVAVLLLVVVLVVAYRQKLTSLFSPAPAPQPQPAPVLPNNTQYTINRDLELKRGSTGPEVKVLQGLLGVTADGIFGPVTEYQLQEQKCATEITLNTFEDGKCIVLDVDLETHGNFSSGNTLDFLTEIF